MNDVWFCIILNKAMNMNMMNIVENLNDYLNNLPSTVEVIDISRRQLLVFPDLSRFTHLKVLNCSSNCPTFDK